MVHSEILHSKVHKKNIQQINSCFLEFVSKKENINIFIYITNSLSDAPRESIKLCIQIIMQKTCNPRANSTNLESLKSFSLLSRVTEISAEHFKNQ